MRDSRDGDQALAAEASYRLSIPSKPTAEALIST